MFQFIPTQSKLHGEEVTGDELGDLLLAGPEGGEADLLSSVAWSYALLCSAQGGRGEVTRPTWLNCAKLASANSGMWPSSSWQQSWARDTCDTWRVEGVTRDTCYRLRGVEGVALVPDVLGAVEHAEGEAGQEVAWREVARHGPHLDTWPLVT